VSVDGDVGAAVEATIQTGRNKFRQSIPLLTNKDIPHAVRWPCGVCGRGLGNNSIQCTSCQKWVHSKCSIKGSMYKVMKSFVCRSCVNPGTGTCHRSVDIGDNANLELVDLSLSLSSLLLYSRF